MLIGEAWRDFSVWMSVGLWTGSEFGFSPRVGSSLFLREHDRRSCGRCWSGKTPLTHRSVHHSAPPEHGSHTMKRRQELERIRLFAVKKFSQMFVRMAGRSDAAASEVAGRRRTDGI